MKYEVAPVRIVQFTPPGRGAIATVLVEGPDARQRVAGQFRSARGDVLGNCPAERLLYGRFGPPPGEDVVVRCRSEQSIEIHCHGGDAAVARIVSLLDPAGLAPLPWRAWAESHYNDPITAAAHLALADARTERTAAILLDQYHGALGQAWKEIRAALAVGNIARGRALLDAILARAPIGRHLVEPWRVVLAGAPNVGKSSLVNALLGYQRAIVHPQPGTTRDVVTASTAVDGWPLVFCDTAGLRQGEHLLEQAGIERAHQQLAMADLVLLVFDISRLWLESDASLRRRFPTALMVHNKSDLAATGSRPAGIAVSASSGAAIPQLLESVVERLVPQPPPPGAAVPFTNALVRQLESAREALSTGDWARALEILDGHYPTPQGGMTR
jgi:tRNA modification GTPase